MNVNRMVNGQADENEKLNKSQVFITTAGYKNTFSYDKLIQLLCMMVARPQDAIILGGSWRTPVVEGLLDKNFVRELKMDGTFNEASFEREYESKWTGDVESAFFSTAQFDKHRVINLAENQYSNKTSKDGYYLLGVDVGRFGLMYSSIKTLLIAGNSLWDNQQLRLKIVVYSQGNFVYNAYSKIHIIMTKGVII